jgi:hypothetical protein
VEAPACCFAVAFAVVDLFYLLARCLYLRFGEPRRRCNNTSLSVPTSVVYTKKGAYQTDRPTVKMGVNASRAEITVFLFDVVAETPNLVKTSNV